jgi:hypothetical protein
MGLWIVWGVSTAVVIACGLWLTRRWRPLWLRTAVRAFCIATLVVPVSAGLADDHWAPAWLVLFFESVLQAEGDPVPALSALTLGWGAALVAAVAIPLLRRSRSRRAEAVSR